jgi:uncharacterized protein YecE (DUF72 family)
MKNDKIHIGTISWKYDSWQRIVYPESKPFNHLQEYSRHYRTVEVDQWFWSLFSGDKAALPKTPVVEEYAGSVPGDFTFGIKVPNSITLTHHYKKKKSDPLIPNPHFLSIHLMQKFLERLAPLSRNIGPLIFQFEYLNKQKMPGKLQQFIDQFGEFAEQLPGGYAYCIEIRNPNYLGEEYFEFLNEKKLHHVFLQGHYMPSIFELYNKYREQIKDLVVIRLHGSNQKEVEAQTGKKWDRIVSPKDSEIDSLAGMLVDLERRGIETFVYVKNDFEGSAPMTIGRLENRLKSQ